MLIHSEMQISQKKKKKKIMFRLIYEIQFLVINFHIVLFPAHGFLKSFSCLVKLEADLCHKRMHHSLFPSCWSGDIVNYTQIVALTVQTEQKHSLCR